MPSLTGFGSAASEELRQVAVSEPEFGRKLVGEEVILGKESLASQQHRPSRMYQHYRTRHLQHYDHHPQSCFPLQHYHQRHLHHTHHQHHNNQIHRLTSPAQNMHQHQQLQLQASTMESGGVPPPSAYLHLDSQLGETASAYTGATSTSSSWQAQLGHNIFTGTSASCNQMATSAACIGGSMSAQLFSCAANGGSVSDIADRLTLSSLEFLTDTLLEVMTLVIKEVPEFTHWLDQWMAQTRK
ncbi:unnamed protein product [Protopolystoma xenopodis]|uniref:Uncharacterized protein n=1 Tax=Protopolystoma xenopodis TaxID=117903 RepID=A0A3S5C6N3_9PLAT|nr:unnamed protein product [Protopolystoma xenopodis]